MNPKKLLISSLILVINYLSYSQLVYNKNTFQLSDYIVVNSVSNLVTNCLPNNPTIQAGPDLKLVFETNLGVQMLGLVDTTFDVHPTICDPKTALFAAKISYDWMGACNGNDSLSVFFLLKQDTIIVQLGKISLGQAQYNLGQIDIKYSVAYWSLQNLGIDIFSSEKIHIGVGIGGNYNCNSTNIRGASLDNISMNWENNLIVNSSFEDCQLVCNNVASTNSPINTINGWTVTDENNTGCTINNAGTSCGLGVIFGAKAIDLQPHSNGTLGNSCNNNYISGLGIEQSFPTEIGEEYEISFHAASNNGGALQDLKVLLDNILFQNVNIIGNNYNLFTYSFVASSSQTSINFVNLQTEVAVTALDEIKVVKKINPILPQTIHLCINDSLNLTSISPTSNWTCDSSHGEIQDVYFHPNPSSTLQQIPLVEHQQFCNLNHVVTVFQTPDIQFLSDTAICEYEKVTLFATSSNYPNSSMVWENNFTNDSTFYQSTYSETYIVTATNQFGCKKKDSITIIKRVAPIADFQYELKENCGSNLGRFYNFSSSDCVSAFWLFSDGAHSSKFDSISHLFFAKGEALATLVVQNQYSCIDTASYSFYINNSPITKAEFQPSFNSILDAQNEIQFTNTSENASHFTWDFGDGTFSNEVNPLHVYEPNSLQTEFHVTLIATSDLGCIDSAQFTISIYTDFAIYVPNTFTPDGEQFNNVFIPVYPKKLVFDFYQISIFNRWGELLFTSADETIGWDGTYKNTSCSDGIYIWVLEYQTEFEKEKNNISGHLTLMK